mmetsp:Transcript_86320/g.217284  ORF Transcript_86320/g.217284 Transcript_86320/m.217284 type:complete len:245 (-) Transcript_86320:747-1481(-)
MTAVSPTAGAAPPSTGVRQSGHSAFSASQGPRHFWWKECAQGNTALSDLVAAPCPPMGRASRQIVHTALPCASPADGSVVEGAAGNLWETAWSEGEANTSKALSGTQPCLLEPSDFLHPTQPGVSTCTTVTQSSRARLNSVEPWASTSRIATAKAPVSSSLAVCSANALQILSSSWASKAARSAHLAAQSWGNAPSGIPAACVRATAPAASSSCPASEASLRRAWPTRRRNFGFPPTSPAGSSK